MNNGNNSSGNDESREIGTMTIKILIILFLSFFFFSKKNIRATV